MGEEFLMNKNTCCFFGHRDTPSEISDKLEQTIIDLIENKSVDTFYVGNQGSFDFMVRETLKRLKVKYPHINYSVVLAYMPGKREEYEDYSDTIYPDGLENVPRKFAIDRRNKWLVDNSDYVIAYISRSFGGAAKFYELAVKRKKNVINLYDTERAQPC